MRPEVHKVLDEMYREYEAHMLPFIKLKTSNAAFDAALQYEVMMAGDVLDSEARTFAASLSKKEQLEVRDYLATKLTEVTRKLGERGGKTPPPIGQATIDAYHTCLTAMYEGSRQQPDTLRPLDGDDSLENRERGLQQVRSIWAQLRGARVFDFEPETYSLAYAEADRYACKLGGVKWRPVGDNVPSHEVISVSTAVDAAARSIPFPTPLPFETMFIGFGRGIGLKPQHLIGRIISGEARKRTVGAAVIGMLVHASEMRVTEMIQIVEPVDNYIVPNITCEQGVWMHPLVNMHPWVVTHLIGIINDHRQLVVEKKPGFRERFDTQKLGKKLSIPTMIPQPYYVVRLHKQLVIDTGKKMRRSLSQIQRELTYRYDRRGHERCYVRRGKLPLTDKDREALEKAKYKIWTIEQPDATAYRQLLERGQPPKAADEWLAILTRWIDQTVVGAEQLPYIPALRLPEVQSG